MINSERNPDDYDLHTVAEVADKDISRLIRAEILKLSLTNMLYYTSVLSTLFLLSYHVFYQPFDGGLLFQFTVGILLGLLIIPLHEFLHGTYFSLLGCESVDYRFDWKRGEFSASAHHFLITKKEYILLLLFPFLIVWIDCTILYLILSELRVLILTTLLMHISVCAADFALVNFVGNIKNEKLKVYYYRGKEKTLFTMFK